MTEAQFLLADELFEKWATQRRLLLSASLESGITTTSEKMMYQGEFLQAVNELLKRVTDATDAAL